MKNWFRTFMMMVACIALLTFTSCEKEDMDETEQYTEPNTEMEASNETTPSTSGLQTLSQNTEKGSTTQTEGESEFCVTIDYPIEVVYPDGNTTSVNSDDEFITVVDDWYDVPEEVADLTLTFPISVTLEDGSQSIINDEDAFEDLIEDCFGDFDDEEGEDDDDEDEGDDDDDDCFEDFDDCFELVYPVTIILPDGTSNTVNDDDEIDDLIDAFYDANEEVEEDPTFDYPITVAFDDGDEIINSDEELEALFEECEEGWGEEDYDDYEECFEWVFPISAELPDGTSITANDEDELDDAIDAFYDANQNVEEDPTLVYPISVVYEDGTTATANSDEELDALYDDCE